MKKLILVVSLIVVLFLMGCSKNTIIENNNPLENSENQQQEENAENNVQENHEDEFESVFNAKEYEGSWITAEDMNKNFEADGGRGLFLKVKDSDTIDFEYTVVSAAPANRIAIINIENVKLDDNHIGSFTWEDSWYNKGNGTIKLEAGKVVINITDTQVAEDAMWGIFDSEVIFTEKNNVENLINFKYTSLEDLKNQIILPIEVKIGEYYDIGNVKLGNNTFNIKYVKETVNGKDAENEVSIEEKLKFYKDDVQKLELLVSTEVWWEEYTKEISIFKDKYLVTVSNTNVGDSFQSLEIYDDNLSKVTNYDEAEKTIIDGAIKVHCGYENYYLIEDDYITYIDNRYDYNKNIETKVTSSISEENGSWKINLVDQTTEGVRPGAGRT